MKHRVSGKKLGRTRNQRQALIKGLVRSVFTYGSIQTTEAKAKAAVSLVEKMAHTAMQDDLSARRELFKVFQNQNQVNNIISQMKSVFGDQTSNFTKIKKLYRRQGDDAVVVSFAFVKPIDFKVAKASETEKEAKKVEKKTEKVAKAAPKKTPAKKTVKKEAK